MTSKKRKYDAQFKREAVQLYETSTKTVAQIESDLGITTGRLNKWRAQFKQEGVQAFPGTGHQTELEAELMGFCFRVQMI